MANINEILARAESLRKETALNSIDPERAGGIMYDTLLALNELWLQQGAALVISKIYASVAAMEADTAPVSDLTGKPMRPGQIVVIASSDSDNGSVYRYNGTESPSWSLVGSIGNLEPVDNLESDSTTLPLAAHQGKVLDGKISQLGQEIGNIIFRFHKENTSGGQNLNFPITIKAGARVVNKGASIICATDSNLTNRIDLAPGEIVDLEHDVAYIKSSSLGGDVDILFLDNEIAKIEDSVDERVTKGIRNIVDKYADDVALGHYLKAGGSVGANSSYNTTGFIKVKPNTTYYVGCEELYDIRFLNFYNNRKIHISSSQQTDAYKFTTPANCYYIRASFYVDYWDNRLLQITEGARYDYAPYSPISEYLQNNRYTDERYPIKVLGKNKLNPNSVTLGYFLKANGTLSSNGNYFVTDFIRFEQGKMIASIDGLAMTTGSGYICYYNEAGTLLSSHTIISTLGIATWYEGVSFVRFSVASNTAEHAQVEYGEFPTTYEPYGFYVQESSLPPQQVIEESSSQRGNATLAAGESFTLPLVYCRYAQTLTAIISGTIGANEDVEIGRTLNFGQYSGQSIKITPTTIIIAGVSYSHGLTLTNRTFLTLIADNKCLGKVIIITSAGDKYEVSDLYTGSFGGEAFAKNNTSASISVELSLELRKLNSPSWIFGDSYCSPGDSRWPYYVLEWGADNFLMDNLSGGTSENLYNSLINLLKIGCPKYIVWCLGMNGGNDGSSAPNMVWETYLKSVIAQCVGRNITPILATIPSVPDRPHEKLNEWVRNSGYRYIDFAKAVNAQPDGTWDAGLLSNDNVHPTAEGARVLASRVLLDFPEITLND